MITNVLEYLENSAAQFPDKIALADENGGITYAQYLEMAKRVGTYISKQLSGPGEERVMNSPVAVLIDRSIFSIVAFMGVVYSGNFYVPVDPNMPEERINLILDTLNPVMILDATDNDDEPHIHHDCHESEEPEENLDEDDFDCEDDGIDYLEIAVTEPVDDKLLAEIRGKITDINPDKYLNDQLQSECVIPYEYILNAAKDGTTLNIR